MYFLLVFSFVFREGASIYGVCLQLIHSRFCPNKIIKPIIKRSQETRIFFHFVLTRLHICTALQSLLCIYLI